MLSINMEDVVNVLNSVKSHLIAILVILIVGVLLAVLAGRMGKRKSLVRGSAILAMILAITLCVNLICTGPMSTMLDLVTGRGTIEEETAKTAQELAVQIGREGMVLVENNENLLPLAPESKLNVFGWASTAACYGGAGSGGLNDAYDKVTPLQSLADAGIETNAELSNFYVKYKDGRPEVGMWAQDWTLPEPAVSLYTDDMIANARKFSDTAMFFIARSGGEGADLPYDMAGVVNGSYQDGTTYTAATYDDSLNAGNDWNEGDTYLDLSNRERELLDLVCQNFDKVLVVVNCSNSFNLTFVEAYPQIKSVIWAPSQGHVGFTALGEIISGAVNPSGRLVDTYVRDFKATPWWNNFGDFNYTNMDEFKSTTRFGGGDVIPSFVNYVEGIYVGYRFYETAASEGLINYADYVQYPFGHGLSYTTFTQTMGSLTETDTTVEFDVIVENTGDAPGKEVVQAYCNPPYTDRGIEKATANLVQFEKTDLLQPGDRQTVHMVINKDDLMSYDYQRSRSYVLEAGPYTISINRNSHEQIASQVWIVPEMTVYNNNNKRASDKVTASNLFDFAAGNVEYLSRAGHFANYPDATAAPTDFEMSPDKKATFYNISNYLTAEATALDEDPGAAPITVGAKNGLTLADVRGLDKDDPKWDQLMDQMTLNDMNAVISLGGYQTAAVASVGKVRTNDCDGPSSINNNFTGVGSVGFPVGVVIAATFNKQLAHEFGDSIGKMANEMDVSGWYAPAMNIHRTAFAGRNFEYYSEDPILSGYIAAAAVAGSQENGVYAYMKHFAMNDQEGNRCDMLCTWSNEQAIREIYLRPFEKCVKDSDCLAVMSSFNYVGNRWAGGCKELQTDVLRGEWGFKGFVETDYFGVYGYMSADQGIRNGSDLMLVNYATETNDVRFRETNGAQQAMRNSAKNILYVVANSRQYAEGNYNPGMSPWQSTMYIIDAVIVVCAAAVWLLLYRNYRKKSGEQVENSGT